MRTTLLIALLVTAPLRAEIVDRVVAVVDGRVITLSVALAEANYRAFRDGREPVSTLEGEALQTVLSRLTDQELLEKERNLSPFSMPAGEGPQRAAGEIRKRFPAPGQLENALARYRLTEADLLQRLARESTLLAFVDYYLRSRAHVPPDAVERYYRETLLPQLRQQGAPPPELHQVSGEIERILTEKEINRLLDEWLRELRARARIRIVQ